MREVLVAVDDSEASERAAEFVNGFFNDLDVSITAVNVGRVPLSWGPYAAAPGVLYPWPPPWPAGTVPPREVGAPSDRLERHDEIGDRILRSSGIQADRTSVEFGGDVADTLVRVAEERGAEVIVVGSADKGFFERLVSPSVSRELARDAPVPVLVVH